MLFELAQIAPLCAVLAGAPAPPEPDPGDNPLPGLEQPTYRTGARLGVRLPPKPWSRRHGWMAVRLGVGGGLAGQAPAAPSVVALGGGVDLGWRINNIVGLGLGFGRQPHATSTLDASGLGLGTIRDRGHLTTIDLAFLRAYYPTPGTFQPWLEVGGGAALIEPPDSAAPLSYGGQLRAGLGFDAWLLPMLSVGVGLEYRYVVAGRSEGHRLGGTAALGFHF